MTEDAHLQRWLGSHRDAVAEYPASDHIDVDTLTRHAAGQLSPAKARIVSEHLLACDDGRCGDFVRAQAADMEAVRVHLYAADAPAGERSRPRTFQSREIVWATLESMSRELDVPIDDLMNEAMAAYARVRGYPVPDLDPGRAAPASARTAAAKRKPPGPAPHDERDPLDETHDVPEISDLDRSYLPRSPGGFEDDDLARTAARGAFARPEAARSSRLPSEGPESRTTPRTKPRLPAALERPVPLAPLGAPAAKASGPLSSPRSTGPGLAPPPARRSSAPAPLLGRSALGGAPPPPPARLAPPASPRLSDPPRESSIPSTPRAKRLVLSYEGRQYHVDKDRFLLGRSKAQSDLRLDDPNVSRQHAAIERVGAAWYVVDLGSTNGVHVAGERVARRALADGDVIVITSHEIRCSLS